MFEFCLPTKSNTVPDGPDWFHEIKYDGYRLRVERDNDRVRLITKGGYDRTNRYPWIVEAALKNRQKHFVIDGEAVILGVDGYSDFNALHSGKHNDEVQLLGFTCWPWTATTCEICRYLCVKPTLRGYSLDGWTASS
jgi:bifunctional non-homologous end joining protein LigD